MDQPKNYGQVEEALFQAITKAWEILDEKFLQNLIKSMLRMNAVIRVKCCKQNINHSILTLIFVYIIEHLILVLNVLINGE